MASLTVQLAQMALNKVDHDGVCNPLASHRSQLCEEASGGCKPSAALPIDLHDGLQASMDSTVDSQKPASQKPNAASGVQDKSTQLPCFDFTKGQCLRGDTCRYSHDLSTIVTFNSKEKGICFDYLRNQCHRGLLCRFSHDLSHIAQQCQVTGPNKGRSTAVCYDFVKGVCQRGDECRYSHDLRLIASTARGGTQSQKSGELCYDYLRGRCTRGNNCKYSHTSSSIAQNSAFLCPEHATGFDMFVQSAPSHGPSHMHSLSDGLHGGLPTHGSVMPFPRDLGGVAHNGPHLANAISASGSPRAGAVQYNNRPSLPYAADNDIRRPDQPISGSIPSHNLHSLPPQFPALPRPSQGYDPGPGNAQQVSQGLAGKSNFEAQPDAFPHFHHQEMDQASQQMHPYGHPHQHAQQQQHRQLPYPGHVYGGDSEHMAQGMLRSHSAPHPLAMGFGVTPLSVSAIISSLGNAHPQLLAETLAGLAAAAQAQAQQTHAHHGIPGPGAAQSSHRLPPRAPVPMAPPHPPTQYYVASHTPGHAAEDAKSLPCSKPSSGLTTASSSPVAGQGSCPQPIPSRHNPSSQSSSSWSASLPRQLAAGTASSNCVGWALSGVDSPSGPLGALEGLLPGPQVPPPPPAVRAPLSSTAQLVPDLLPLLKEIWNKP